MIDEDAFAQGTTAGVAGEHGEAITAFCQQCGRALTSSSRRQVGSAIYCEPCAVAHAAHTAGWTPVNGAAPGPRGPAAPYAAGGPPPRPGEPNPVLAGFLGLIPGVGAMYNGQYPKGAIHLIVFVVLVSLADNLNWVFWWFVWGWVFYQAFDAYHTALARRDGLPLPDPFGWNELNERFGGGRSWPSAMHRPQTGFASPAAHGAPPSPAPPPVGFPAGSQTPAAPSPEAAAARQSDYPSAAAYGYAPPASPFAADPAQVPYAPTFTGTGFPVATVPVLDPNDLTRRFPAGAVWLIGLGALFLLGNLIPSFRLDGRWLVPLLLAAIALWTGARRLTALPDARQASGAGGISYPLPAKAAAALLGPAILFTLAVLLAFQAGHVVLLRHSWPALLIVWGAMLVVERSSPRLEASWRSAAVPSPPPSGEFPR